MTIIKNSVLLDLITSGVRDGECVDLDDVAIDAFLRAVEIAKTQEPTDITIDDDGSVWYQNRRIHIPPKPKSILAELLVSPQTISHLQDAAKTKHVKKHVNTLNNSLGKAQVTHVAFFDCEERLYKFF